MSKTKGNLCILIAAIIGGVGILGMKYLLDEGYSTFQVIFLRFLFSSVIMGLLFVRDLQYLTKAEIRAGVIMGIFLYGMFLFTVVGLKYTTASVNGFLVSLQAIFVPFMCWVRYKKRPMVSSFIAAGLSLLGIALLSITEDFRVNIGALISVGASVSYAFQMTAAGDYAVRFDPIRLTVLENFTVLFLAGISLFFFRTSFPPMTRGAMGSLLAVSMISTMIYFLLQTYGQRFTTPVSAAVILSSESMFTALLAVLFFGEPLELRLVLGGIIIFAAIIVNELGLFSPASSQKGENSK